MKNRWCFSSGWALALAGVMLLAGPALAQQNQGGSPGTRGGCPYTGPAAPGSQLCTPGPGGTCAVNPPLNQGRQNCPPLQQQGSQAGPGACPRNQPQTQAQTQANTPATSR